MKLLTDQDVYELTIRFLRDLGHNVLTARESGLATAADDKILQYAQHEGRVLITRDKDFGALVYAQHVGKGVIFLRMNPQTITTTHDELRHLLEAYPENELSEAFVVVEPGQHRFRRLR